MPPASQPAGKSVKPTLNPSLEHVWKFIFPLAPPFTAGKRGIQEVLARFTGRGDGFSHEITWLKPSEKDGKPPYSDLDHLRSQP